MGSFDSVQTFVDTIDNYCDSKLPITLCAVLSFTASSKKNRNNMNFVPFVNSIKKNDDGDGKYFFVLNGKKYCFSVFSDFELQEFDKKVLESFEREEIPLTRILKLACSMDLVNPRVAIGNSLTSTFSLLIVFQENGIDKVIDYNKNIIMKREDYYEAFDYQELNIVDKVDLYNIYSIVSSLNDCEHIYEYLLFTKQIFENLSKNDSFKFLIEEYDSNGINSRNSVLFGNNSDCLYFDNDDLYRMKYASLVRELDNFTKNPLRNTEHILYNQELGCYELTEKDFGFFTFKLLSDIVCDLDIKEKLLSDSRCHECHPNSVFVARSLSDEDKKSALVVGGKFKENECDYFYHSWVEIDEKNVVIDFNYNIIMNRDKYYKLFEVEPISKTLVSDMEDIFDSVGSSGLFDLHIFMINYFGKEIMSDLKRNEKIFRKQK